jgi:hypothetical protein
MPNSPHNRKHEQNDYLAFVLTPDLRRFLLGHCITLPDRLFTLIKNGVSTCNFLMLYIAIFGNTNSVDMCFI